ncbi:MAG: SPOR domain-containing protein [Pseudomonadota bacterium]|nr:MAG: SPOR domain-containing protein [Pseudomonadota bacterium]
MKWVFAFLLLLNLGFWLWVTGIYQRDEQPAPSARPVVAAETMKLLSEPGVKLAPRPKPRIEPPPPAAGRAPSEDRAEASGACYRIGPFPDVESADAAGKVLIELAIAYARETEEQRRIASHRVYLPPFPTKEAAEAKRKELTRAGFRDHALIEDEDLKHAISLGVYSVEANARRHLKVLAAKGVKASIEPLYQIRTVHWLTLRFDADAVRGGNPVAAIKDRVWQPEAVRLHDVVCPRSGEIAAKPESVVGP